MIKSKTEFDFNRASFLDTNDNFTLPRNTDDGCRNNTNDNSNNKSTVHTIDGEQSNMPKESEEYEIDEESLMSVDLYVVDDAEDHEGESQINCITDAGRLHYSFDDPRVPSIHAGDFRSVIIQDTDESEFDTNIQLGGNLHRMTEANESSGDTDNSRAGIMMDEESGTMQMQSVRDRNHSSTTMEAIEDKISYMRDVLSELIERAQANEEEIRTLEQRAEDLNKDVELFEDRSKKVKRLANVSRTKSRIILASLSIFSVALVFFMLYALIFHPLGLL